MAKLWVVAGPIGNLGDLSSRATQVLSEAAVWVVEDTRVSARLSAHLGVKPKFKVLNDHSGPHSVSQAAEVIAGVESAALLTDAGTPGISDPGASLVEECLKRDIEVDALPGPSAVTMALSLSGFFAQRFVFLGFMPRKTGEATQIWNDYVHSTATIVLFESPHRVVKTLETAHEILGKRRVCVCRELTKIYQQVWRGTLDEVGNAQIPSKGEVTIVIEGHRRLKLQ